MGGSAYTACVRRLITGVGDALVVVREAARLLWRHWPVLLAIFLVGAIVHNGALWLALIASRSNAWVAAFLVPLAPLATLVALIFMLRAVSPSLSFGAAEPESEPSALVEAVGEPEPTTPRPRPIPGLIQRMRRAGRAWRSRSRTVNARLRLLAATLIPFITVYTVQGYLQRDRDSFLNSAVSEELRDNFLNVDIGSRLAVLQDTQWVLVAVGVALVVRFLFDVLDVPERGTGWGMLAAWIEICWVTWLAGLFTEQWDAIKGWFLDRAFVDMVVDAWHALTGWLGPLGTVLEQIRSWISALLGNFDALVVIPLAWLSIGAVAYSRTLRTERSHRLDRVTQQVTGRFDFLPSWARGWVGEPVSKATGRFTSLWRGLKTLAVAGLLPMIMFCLIFLLLQHAETAFAELLRVIVGPQRADQVIAFTPYLSTLQSAVASILEVVLLAAAVDRILIRQEADRAEAEAEGSTAPGEPSAASRWIGSLRAGPAQPVASTGTSTGTDT